MLTKKSVEDINVTGKKVLVRCDFNVPMEDGRITDDNRIVGALPTIKYLLAHNARVILCSHMGRPKGEFNPKYSLAPVAKRLSELLGKEVTLAADVVGPDAQAKAAALKDGEVLLLENVRFHKEEEKNDPAFAKQLASLAEIYVNDAFGTAHRAHASTAGVADYLPGDRLITRSSLASSRLSCVENRSSTEVSRPATLFFANLHHLLYQSPIGFRCFPARLMVENALIRRADFRQTHRCGNNRLQDGQMLSEVFLDRRNDLLTEIRFVCHCQKYAADFQIVVDSLFYVLHSADQFRHILRSQIVGLHGNQHIIRSRKGVDDQHTEGRVAVEQHIVVGLLDTVHIAPQHRFPAFVDLCKHLVLPMVTLVILSIGGMMRYTRTNMLEVMNSEYIRTARAKGLSEHTVIYKHAFRNTLIPLVTMVAGIIPSLFGGAMITESVFALDGIGYVAYKAVIQADIPFVMGYNMFIAVLTVFGILLSDLLYIVVDPRVKIK